MSALWAVFCPTSFDFSFVVKCCFCGVSLSAIYCAGAARWTKALRAKGALLAAPLIRLLTAFGRCSKVDFFGSLVCRFFGLLTESLFRFFGFSFHFRLLLTSYWRFSTAAWIGGR